MNEIHVTMRGNVVTDPRHVQLQDGTAVTSFRLASTPRRWDRDRREWISRETVYVTVNCWRALATNVGAAVRKGQPVVVAGRLTERSWTTETGTGRSLEIEAESVGHDLLWGTTEFSRTVRTDRPTGDFQGYEPAGQDDAGEGSAAGPRVDALTGSAAVVEAIGRPAQDHAADPQDDAADPRDDAADPHDDAADPERSGRDPDFPGQVVLDGDQGREPSAVASSIPGQKSAGSGRGRAKATAS